MMIGDRMQRDAAAAAVATLTCRRARITDGRAALCVI